MAYKRRGPRSRSYTPKPAQIIPRTCLTCNTTFDSTGPGNRTCPQCLTKGSRAKGLNHDQTHFPGLVRRFGPDKNPAS